MYFFMILGIFACLTVAWAASEQESLVKVQPITSEQYNSLLNMNSGKSIISVSRLINSAITGITGLATGLQIDKLIPNFFSGNIKNAKDTVGGYPLCTINSNEAASRQLSDISYINIEELSEALARQGTATDGAPIINCVLVLDDGKRQKLNNSTNSSLITTPKPEFTTTTPTTTTLSPTNTTRVATHKPHTYTSHSPYYLWYPSYAPYPYQPPSSYHPYPGPNHPFHPPLPYYYPYIRYPVYKTDEEYKSNVAMYKSVAPVRLPPINFHSFLLDKLQPVHEISETTTARSPTIRTKTRRLSRPSHRPHHDYRLSQHQVYNKDFDEYDDSIDYIEVSK